MPSYGLMALTGLSVLVATSSALPHDGPGRFNGPHGPHDWPAHGFPTGISGSPVFPTGTFPTGFIPSGTATMGLPVQPLPTDEAEDLTFLKRFGGPRVNGPKKPWHHYGPRPPFATGGPMPTGTSGLPVTAPTGGPTAGPTAW